jgi:hypothetical protein
MKSCGRLEKERYKDIQNGGIYELFVNNAVNL